MISEAFHVVSKLQHYTICHGFCMARLAVFALSKEHDVWLKPVSLLNKCCSHASVVECFVITLSIDRNNSVLEAEPLM